MTPFEIKILLQYYSCVGDAPAVKRKPPIIDSTMDGFLRDGLLEHCFEDGSDFTITDKGRCYVEEGLMRVPLPMWTIPAPAQSGAP